MTKNRFCSSVWASVKTCRQFGFHTSNSEDIIPRVRSVLKYRHDWSITWLQVKLMELKKYFNWKDKVFFSNATQSIRSFLTTDSRHSIKSVTSKTSVITHSSGSALLSGQGHLSKPGPAVESGLSSACFCLTGYKNTDERFRNYFKLHWIMVLVI